MLVNFLMEAVVGCHNAGLQVVATACDRGANNEGDETVGCFSVLCVEKLQLYFTYTCTYTVQLYMWSGPEDIMDAIMAFVSR